MRASIRSISFVLNFVCFAALPVITSRAALAQAQSQMPSVQSKMMVDARKAQCGTRFAEFVDELDKVFDTEHSIAPVQVLFKKYFPIGCCEIDQVFDIARKSRYFDEAGKNAHIFTVSFDNQPYHPYSKLFVQISCDRASGNSEPPFVVIHRESA